MMVRYGSHRTEVLADLATSPAKLMARGANLVATLFTILLLLSAASTAHGASFYWYGENDSTCWQVGQPGSPQNSCDTVGAGYLGSHMLEDTRGGVGEDFKLSPSGDWCSYYRIGGAVITQQDSTNEGGTSGLTVPTPYGNYQEGDKSSSAHNACQANGTDWGQVIRGPSGNGCPGNESCGMKHYVSLTSQGSNDRPFNTLFGSPSLHISTEAGVHTFAGSGGYGGWGYICPELEDTSTHGVLEYCLEEWRGANDASEWKNEHIGECNSPWAEVISYFWPGTSLATEISGSTSTFEVGPTGGGHYEAAITESNLVNAANAANHACVGWHLSTNPANYALLGVEQGVEGWSSVSVIGAYALNLQLRTEYSPRPPTASTGGATNTLESGATLTGTVNPNGIETHYHFEYGRTTYYGTTTSEGSVNGGSKNVNVVLTTLPPATTYHYRLVATNLWGTSYGSDQTFTTLPVQAGKVVRDPLSGREWIYYRGVNGALMTSNFIPRAGGSAPVNLGGAIAAGTTPFAVRDPNSGTQWVYYTSASDIPTVKEWRASTGWAAPVAIGNSAAPGTSPSAVYDPIAESFNVFYTSSKDTVEVAYFNPSVGWQKPVGVSYAVAPGTSPSVTYNPSTGAIWGFYTSSSDTIEVVYFNPSVGWEKPYGISNTVAPGTSPSAVYNPNSESFDVFYTGSKKTIEVVYFNPGVGWEKPVGVSYEVATGTSPSAMFNPSTGVLWGFYTDNKNTIEVVYFNPGVGWEKPFGVSYAAAPGTSPAAVYNPDSGNLGAYYRNSDGAEELVEYEAGVGWLKPTEVSWSAAADTSPSAVRDAYSGDQWVYYTSVADVVMARQFRPGVGWSPAAAISNSVAPKTSPFGMYEQATGATWCFYTSSSDTVEVAYFNPNVGWEKPVGISNGVDPGTSPSAVLNPSTGGIDAFYTDNKNPPTIEVAYFNPGVRWEKPVGVSYGAASGTSPFAMINPSNGALWGFYTSSSNTVEVVYFNPGVGWEKPVGISNGVDPGTSPSAVLSPSTGGIDAFYTDNKNPPTIEVPYFAPGSGWLKPVGVSYAVASGTSTFAMINSSTGALWGLYIDSGNVAEIVYFNPNLGWEKPEPFTFSVASGTNPVAVYEQSTGVMYSYVSGANGSIESFTGIPGSGGWVSTEI